MPLFGENFVPSITASRTSGVSPCTVVFSCDGTTAGGYDSHEVWRLFGYSFDFDDPGSGTFNTIRGGSKNTSIGGPMAAHTFEVADGGGSVEFEVLVNIEAPDGRQAQASVTITVQAQDDYYDFVTGTDVIAVSTTLDTGNASEWESGFDRNVPSGATLLNAMPAWNAMSDKLVMLHRGNADFSAVVQTIEYGSKNIVITDFGDDADSRAELRELHIGTQSDAAFDTQANNTDYSGYGGVWIDSVTVEKIRLWRGYTGLSYQHVGFYNIDMDCEVETAGGRMAFGRSGTHCYTAANSLTPANVPFSKGLYISDCTIIGSTTGAESNDPSVNVFIDQNVGHLGVIGNTIRNVGEINFRTHGVQRGAIHDNDILGDNRFLALKNAITIRGTGYGIIDIDGQNRSISTGHQKLMHAQDETFYDNSPTAEGVFDGGTGWDSGDIGETITVTSGTVVTIDAVSGGAVTEFTVDSTSCTGERVADVELTQTGTTGGGSGFSLTPGDTNLHESDNLPYSNFTVVQGNTVSSGVNGAGTTTWNIAATPSSTTELHLMEDIIIRDNVFTSTVNSPVTDTSSSGRYMTTQENTYQGSGSFDNSSAQQLDDIDLGSGTPSLTPNYLDTESDIPVPTAPR